MRKVGKEWLVENAPSGPSPSLDCVGKHLDVICLHIIFHITITIASTTTVNALSILIPLDVPVLTLLA